VTHFTQGSGEGGWGAARADLGPPAQTGQDEVRGGSSADAAWTVERLAGSADQLHRLGLSDPSRRRLRWCRADGPALVLGSAQPGDHVDRAAAAALALPVVRRLSGGSSVVVGPGRVAWLDVVVPAGDPLWSDDVGVAPLWLGRAWAAALATLGASGLAVHAGRMRRSPWSDHVCFAGTAPGEVGGPAGKVVGISQRRTRAAALFQCGVVLHWDPAAAVAALAVDRPAAAAALAGAARGLDVVLGRVPAPGELEAAFERTVGSTAPVTGEGLPVIPPEGLV
jgi:lipoate-protein ligase A